MLAAEQTRVEFTGGRLLVKAPKSWKRWSPFSDGGSVEVSIELPAGSQLSVSSGVASVRGTGTLGDTRLASGGGDVHLERTGTLRARSGFGDLEIEHVAGDADIATGSGTARIGAIDGSATIKNSNGDSWVGLAGQGSADQQRERQHRRRPRRWAPSWPRPPTATCGSAR